MKLNIKIAIRMITIMMIIRTIIIHYNINRRLGEAFGLSTNREIVSLRSLARTHARKISARECLQDGSFAGQIMGSVGRSVCHALSPLCD